MIMMVMTRKHLDHDHNYVHIVLSWNVYCLYFVPADGIVQDCSSHFQIEPDTERKKEDVIPFIVLVVFFLVLIYVCYY